jgi:hypothetical protein
MRRALSELKDQVLALATQKEIEKEEERDD